MFVIIGWVVALGCVFGVFIAHGGNISVVLKALPFEMTTIMGAALGAFIANNQMKVLKASAAGLASCFKGSKYTKARYMELMALLYEILDKTRKEGLLAIERDIESPKESALFKKYPGRFELWHIKDVFGLKKVNSSLGPNDRVSSMTFVPVGVGHIDFKPVFAQASLAGLKHFVIEQDNAATWGDSLSAARVSYQNLRAILS